LLTFRRSQSRGATGVAVFHNAPPDSTVRLPAKSSEILTGGRESEVADIKFIDMEIYLSHWG